MYSTRGSAALVLIASLALAGCSAPPSAGSPSGSPSADISASGVIEPTSAAAVGESISGNGYSFFVPEGWAERSMPGVDVLAVDLTDTDGFSDNVNVVLSPGGTITPEQMETAGADQLTKMGATDVTVRDRVTVAGSETAHLSAGLSIAGTGYQIEQFAVTNDGQSYVVTFSFSLTVSVADRDDLSRSVLATWAWA